MGKQARKKRERKRKRRQMRYVKIPEDVILTQPDGKEIPEAKPVKFLEWFQVSLLVDPQLGKKHTDVISSIAGY